MPTGIWLLWGPREYIYKYEVEQIVALVTTALMSATMHKLKMPQPHLEGSALLYTVTLISCLGFLLIGFDNGLMGGFVNSTAFTSSVGVDSGTSTDTYLIALIVSIFEIGAFFGCITTSFFGQQLGRRRSIIIGVVIMTIGNSDSIHFMIHPH